MIQLWQPGELGYILLKVNYSLKVCRLNLHSNTLQQHSITCQFSELFWTFLVETELCKSFPCDLWVDSKNIYKIGYCLLLKKLVFLKNNSKLFSNTSLLLAVYLVKRNCLSLASFCILLGISSIRELFQEVILRRIYRENWFLGVHLTVFYLDFKSKSWTTLENSIKTMSRR